MVEERSVSVVGGKRAWFVAAVAAVALLVLWGAGSARAAATWTVQTTADDATGNAAACSNGKCPTLRDAVAKADSDSGDTIVLPGSASHYQVVNGELTLSSNMTIKGAGASTVTIDGGGKNRLFFIPSGPTVTISGVTLTGGNSVGTNSGSGGAIDVQGTLNLDYSVVTGNSANTSGGAIDANGSVNVDHSTISNNKANAGLGIGGAIDCFCTEVTLTDSTLSGNTSSYYGAGIFYSSGTPLVITDSTLSGNMAGDGGGGLYLSVGGANLSNDTFASNTATTAGGGIDQQSYGLNMTNLTIARNNSPQGANYWACDCGNSTVQNTIFADAPSGQTNCYAAGELTTSKGGNLQDESPSSSSQYCWQSSQPTDQASSSANPKLGSLANNGGPTETLALLPGSAAIDKGVSNSLKTDQRGGPRPQPPGGKYDVGAYEVGAVVDMGIAKSASPNPVKVGQTLTYTLKATNDGPSPDPAFDVVVRDTLPGAVTFKSASASQGSCSNSAGTVTCALGTVGHGSSATVTIKVVTKRSGTITNTGTVASSALDPNKANDSANVSTKVKAAAKHKPQARTGGATGLSPSGSTVHGRVNPEKASTTYYFEYGTTTHYGNRTASGGAGSGGSFRSVSRSLSGLRADTVYHYRIVAHNAHGAAFGRDRTFKTANAPAFTG